MVELADTAHSKCVAYGTTGSSLVTDTNDTVVVEQQTRDEAEAELLNPPLVKRTVLRTQQTLIWRLRRAIERAVSLHTQNHILVEKAVMCYRVQLLNGVQVKTLSAVLFHK